MARRLKACVCAKPDYEHQVNWGTAFAEGLRRHGWDVSLSSTYDQCDFYVQWGVRRSDFIARAIKDGAKVCIIERGYIADRHQWCSVSFGGGLNGRAEFRGPLADPSRWERHFAHLMKPWRDGDQGYALIMGQTPGDTAVRNINLPKFYEEAAAEFTRQGFETAFRPHPNMMRGISVPINEQFRGARCAVTWNSNSGVDAIMAGVPTVAMDQGSMAWDVAGHEFAMPPKPDRTAWAHAMAWKQWTKDEMASGQCWDALA